MYQPSADVVQPGDMAKDDDYDDNDDDDNNNDYDGDDEQPVWDVI